MFSIALAKSPRDDALGSRIHDQRVWPPAIFNQAFGWEWASDETVNSSRPIATRLRLDRTIRARRDCLVSATQVAHALAELVPADPGYGYNAVGVCVSYACNPRVAHVLTSSCLLTLGMVFNAVGVCVYDACNPGWCMYSRCSCLLIPGLWYLTPLAISWPQAVQHSLGQSCHARRPRSRIPPALWPRPYSIKRLNAWAMRYGVRQPRSVATAAMLG